MKRILALLALVAMTTLGSLGANCCKIGQTFKITGINPKISPPLYLTNQQGQQIAKLKDITNPYQGRTTPGMGVATYIALKDISDTDVKNASARVAQVTTATLAPSAALLLKLPQPSTGTLISSRAPSGPGTRTPLRAQAAQDVRIATISEQPAAKGTLATTTPAPQPSQGRVEDIVIPPGMPQRMAVIEQLEYPRKITPTYTSMTTRPQQAGTALVEEPVLLEEPQYGTITYDTSALESAAERAKRAAENLRQQTAFATLSQEEKQKMLIEAVQKTDLETVQRILNSGFKDNGTALEEAELFDLGAEDANAQEIIRLLRESAGIADLEALEQELQS